MKLIVVLARRILWLEPLILTGMIIAFWNPTPARLDWLWLLWLLIPILVARFIVHGRWLTRTPLDIVFVAFLVLGVINVAVAPYTRGLMMLARPLLGIALYYSLVEHTRAQGNLRGPLQVMIILSLVVGVMALGASQWGLLDQALLPITTNLPVIEGSLIGGGFNANEIAGAMAWLLPFMTGLAIYRWRTRGIRWDVTLAGFMLLAAILLGQSRATIIGVFFAFVFISLLLPNRWRIFGGLLIVGLIALEIIIVVGNSAKPSLPTEASTPAAPTLAPIGATVNARQEIWNSALAITRDYPLTGVGLSLFRDRRVREQYPVTSSAVNFLPHAHNEYLQILSDMGFPGLIVFLAKYVIVFGMLFRAWRMGDDETRTVSIAVAAGLIAHAIYGLADAITLWDRFAFIFWMMLGIAGSVYHHALTFQSQQQST